MLVLYKRVKTKHREFIYRTKCFYYNPLNSKKKRGVRVSVAGEGKKARNKRQAYLKIKHDCYENFDLGDFWITLTYKKWREPEEADKILSKVLSKMQKRLKRRNIPFVWYKTTEASDTQRAHHHLFIRKTSPEISDMLIDYWNEYGKIKEITKITDMKSGYLVKYFLDGGKHKNLTYQKFGHSRNLRTPEIFTRVVPVNSIRDDEKPRPPKCKEYGYRYKIENVFTGYKDIDGFTYQEYELVKVKKKE